MSRRALRVLVLLGLVLAGLLLQASVAGAVLQVGSPKTPPRLRSSDTNTQLRLTSLGPGQEVSGFIADPGNPFNPVTEGYPTSDPDTTMGWSARDEGFAGVIHAQPPGGSAEISLYCIDISTETFLGTGYVLGTWDRANVPNVGWVARLLNEYYPTHRRTGRTDRSQREGRRGAGGDLVLQRPLRAEDVESACTTPWPRSWITSSRRARCESRGLPASPSPRRI